MSYVFVEVGFGVMISFHVDLMQVNFSDCFSKPTIEVDGLGSESGP